MIRYRQTYRRGNRFPRSPVSGLSSKRKVRISVVLGVTLALGACSTREEVIEHAKEPERSVSAEARDATPFGNPPPGPESISDVQDQVPQGHEEDRTKALDGLRRDAEQALSDRDLATAETAVTAYRQALAGRPGAEDTTLASLEQRLAALRAFDRAKTAREAGKLMDAFNLYQQAAASGLLDPGAQAGLDAVIDDQEAKVRAALSREDPVTASAELSKYRSMVEGRVDKRETLDALDDRIKAQNDLVKAKDDLIKAQQLIERAEAARAAGDLEKAFSLYNQAGAIDVRAELEAIVSQQEARVRVGLTRKDLDAASQEFDSYRTMVGDDPSQVEGLRYFKRHLQALKLVEHGDLKRASGDPKAALDLYTQAADLQVQEVNPRAAIEAIVDEQKSRVQSGIQARLEEAKTPPRPPTSSALFPKMKKLPAGQFRMGSPSTELDRSEAEKPEHEVEIGRPFAIATHETTFAQWDACVAAGGCGHSPDDKKGWGRGDRPVINVSWDDVGDYLGWLSAETGHRYRLPTEAEWEYAARAGTTTPYWWGDQIPQGQANCSTCGSRWDARQTAPVGSFAPNPFGLYDMSGNVREWVQDCDTQDYEKAPTDGSAQGEGDCSTRVVRGGAFGRTALKARSATRGAFPRAQRDVQTGFRVVRDL